MVPQCTLVFSSAKSNLGYAHACVCVQVEERGCCGRRWFGCLGPDILQRAFLTFPRSRKQGASRALPKGFSCLPPGGIWVGTAFESSC